MADPRWGGRYLVDTSVFVRWYLQQIGYKEALDVRAAYGAGATQLETVDFVRFELGHVLRSQGLLKDRLTADEYVMAVRSIDDAGIHVHVTTADVLEQAADLAASRMLRFFDALLVAWSIELGMTVLTVDQKLCNAVAGIARTKLLLPGAP